MNAKGGESRLLTISLKRLKKFKIELVLRIKLELSMMRSIGCSGSSTTGRSGLKSLEEMIIEQSKMPRCSMPKAGKFQVLEAIVTLELQRIFQESGTFTKDRFPSLQLKQLLNWESRLIKNTSETQKRSILNSCRKSKSNRAIRNKKIWLDGCSKIKRK